MLGHGHGLWFSGYTPPNGVPSGAFRGVSDILPTVGCCCCRSLAPATLHDDIRSKTTKHRR